jgi:hypothetical protein
VKYVTAVTDKSGRVVPLRGGAKLSITSLIADHDPTTGQPYPYPNRAELVNVSGYPTFRQVAWADSDRHFTYVGLGVRARLPFRVFTLPDRLVIDVAHPLVIDRPANPRRKVRDPPRLHLAPLESHRCWSSCVAVFADESIEDPGV